MRYLTALLLLMLAVPALADDDGWKEVRHEDGITVWTRSLGDSPVRQVRARTIVDASIERLRTMLSDVPSLPEYMPYMLEAKVLAKDADGTQYEYYLLDPPLVSRRDYTLKVTIEDEVESRGVWQRHWSAAPERGPGPRDGVVRLKIVNGRWELKRIDATHTEVTYWLHTDPGGSIPAWIANRANQTSLPDLMEAVRRRAVDPKWTP